MKGRIAILKIKCGRCGFKIEHVIYTNEYGYFIIPEMYCPNEFNRLDVTMDELPVDVVEVKNANQYRSKKVPASR